MHVWIFEDNLMWSARLRLSALGFGHTCDIVSAVPDGVADAAIVNLGSATIPAMLLITELQSKGIKVIAHAGHKEKELLELGRGLGVDILASNSELSNKFHKLLEQLAGKP